ncbi:hypothetical protein BGZ99_007454 [Dissophora globulifera]|uniref:Uncharacterized protein n=1 Tax=Dissophora globulifera TaxID=979702 RepID=A0A9P6R9E7_9FUNG|nr:hypothetical protein BGZ99_007454 [Dissophora globulifera]
MDSVVDQKQVVDNKVEVSGDLMAFRNSIIENKGVIPEPFKKVYSPCSCKCQDDEDAVALEYRAPG